MTNPSSIHLPMINPSSYDQPSCDQSFILSLGMMVEAMAGKSACLHGICHDATPFTFSEDQPAVKYFAELLVKGECSL
jgi:hypothetical protein